MIFASPLFLFLFLPLTLAGYFLTRGKLRALFLLMMSLMFYVWGGTIYIFLLLGLTLFNYIAGKLIHHQSQKQAPFFTARQILILCIILNLGVLLYFKYTPFFIINLNFLFSYLALESLTIPQITLPIGISFFIFQMLSYIIDIYQKEIDIPPNLANFALYITFFTQLIAGPIVRYRDVAKQMACRTVTRQQFSTGIQRFIFGLSKKVILANPLGEVADKIFSAPGQDITTGVAWLGIICYTLQIYLDFSGYSDMAIGLGRLFGFELPENFNFPYMSQSIREFWRRWHISLSSWFRDYVYIPLGGSRVSARRTYINLWAVFFLCGLWHGASWNFVVWGALHGVYLVMERVTQKYQQQLWRPLRHGYTLLLVMIGWVFFRTGSLTQAVRYLATMIGWTQADGVQYYVLLYCDLKTVLTLFLGCISATPIARYVGMRLQDWGHHVPSNLWQHILNGANYCLLVFLFWLSAAYLAASTYNPFIYFQF